MTINCLIVDDEPIARGIIRSHVDRLPNWRIIGECVNATEAFGILKRENIDVLFLDIQMPETLGTDFLRSLSKRPFVIFTTAYSSYALEGFELDVIDYLLKPITFDRFHQAVEKIHYRYAMKSEQMSRGKDHVFLKHEHTLLKITLNTILYTKAERDFTSFYLSNDTLFISMHLKKVEELLPQSLFTRVHRSFIVNHTKIESISGNMVIVGHTKIPIGPNYKEEFLKKIGL